MANWSRISLMVAVSIFFSWCVGFFAWPCLPRPKPLMVFARITVGWPLCFTAAAYAAYTLCGSWPPRFRRQMSSSLMRATSSAAFGCLPKKCLRTNAPSFAL